MPRTDAMVRDVATEFRRLPAHCRSEQPCIGSVFSKLFGVFDSVLAITFSRAGPGSHGLQLQWSCGECWSQGVLVNRSEFFQLVGTKLRGAALLFCLLHRFHRLHRLHVISKYVVIVRGYAVILQSLEVGYHVDRFGSFSQMGVKWAVRMMARASDRRSKLRTVGQQVVGFANIGGGWWGMVCLGPQRMLYSAGSSCCGRGRDIGRFGRRR